jgi:hypothetical protein
MEVVGTSLIGTKQQRGSRRSHRRPKAADNTVGNRVARLQLASEARATGRHAAADQFTERAAELLDPDCKRRIGEIIRSATADDVAMPHQVHWGTVRGNLFWLSDANRAQPTDVRGVERADDVASSAALCVLKSGCVVLLP